MKTKAANSSMSPEYKDYWAWEPLVDTFLKSGTSVEVRVDSMRWRVRGKEALLLTPLGEFLDVPSVFASLPEEVERLRSLAFVNWPCVNWSYGVRVFQRGFCYFVPESWVPKSLYATRRLAREVEVRTPSSSHLIWLLNRMVKMGGQAPLSSCCGALSGDGV